MGRIYMGPAEELATSKRELGEDRIVYVDRPIEVEKVVFVDVEKIVYVDKPIETIYEKTVEVDKIIEVEKIVYQPVEVEIEKIVFVDVEKIVEVPVIQEKIVYVDKPVIKEVQKIVFKERAGVDRIVFTPRTPNWLYYLICIETLVIFFMAIK